MCPLVELPQPCVEVSADRCEAGAWQQARQLRDAAHAAGANRRGLAKVLQYVLDARHVRRPRAGGAARRRR
jgi:hypothetical protein